MTAWACGSRAIVASPYILRLCRRARLEHVVATAGLKLVRPLGQDGRVDEALVGEKLREGVEPAFVIARGLAFAFGVRDLRDELRLKLAPLELGLVAPGPGHGADAPLPCLVEDQLAVLPRQRRHALHIGDLTARDG